MLLKTGRSKDIIPQLLEQGALVDTTDKNGNAPLLHAIKSSHLHTVYTLIENGADINKTDPFGDTPLIVAADTGNKSVLELLLDYKPNTDVQNSIGDTALMFAANKDSNFLEYLLNKEDAALVNSRGNSALFVACIKQKVSNILKLAKVNPTMLTVKNKKGITPLHIIEQLSKQRKISNNKYKELKN